MKKIRLFLLLNILLIVCGIGTAQAGGQLPINNFTDPDACYCIDANSTGTFKFTVECPFGADCMADIDSVVWKAYGGIEIDHTYDMSAEIRVKQGDTYAQRFHKYSKGRLHVTVYAKDTIIWKWTEQDCYENKWEVRRTLPPYLTEFYGEIDICKQFPMPADANKIVGPICVAQGEEVTYSVAPWVTLSDINRAGTDKYFWKYSEGLRANGTEEYYSADGSSTTFTADNVEGGQLSVVLGSCNEFTQEPLYLNLQKAIPVPDFTPNSCLAGGIHEETFTIQDAMDSVTYEWRVDDNWTFIGSNIGKSVVIKTDAANPATIIVTANYTNGANCEPVIASKRITRTFAPDAKIVSSSGNCVTAGADVRFSIDIAPSPAKFVWNYEDINWAVSNGRNDDKIITLTSTNTSATSATLQVYVAGCSPDSVLTLPINLKPGNANPILSNNGFCITPGVSYTFSTTPTTPAPTSYSWNLGNGWTPSSGTGLSITAVANTSIANGISVTPINNNGCSGTPATRAIALIPTTPEGITFVEDRCINSGMEDQLTFNVINAKSNEHYVWDLDDIGDILYSNSNYSNIVVKTYGIDNTYNLTVSATTNNTICTSSTPSAPLSLSIEGLQGSVTQNVSRKYYSITPTPIGAWDVLDNNYYWELDEINVTNSSSSSRTIDNLAPNLVGSSDHDFFVIIDDYYMGCKTKKIIATKNALALKSVFVSASLQNSNKQQIPATMLISPNPVNSILHVDFSDVGTTNIIIVDMAGNIVKRLHGQNKNVSIDVSDLAQETYVLKAVQNGKRFNGTFIKQ
ncbi:MAG: T9SS type A sorting domain-containing protein [Bacteroidales bacterium]|jgi:hypothetical protein|nr:T9SS type A sorting domain-containing protein [Bacteroidales bacterium]